ncbi:MAG: hypothetical protein PHG85_02870, partial [Candidatus Altiarchaeota archaeon]|nr:hypothetical protein [Candidatus Altiarchaeota archaeon]
MLLEGAAILALMLLVYTMLPQQYSPAVIGAAVMRSSDSSRELNVSVAGNASIPLSLENGTTLAGVRFEGVFTGDGAATVYLVSGGARVPAYAYNGSVILPDLNFSHYSDSGMSLSLSYGNDMRFDANNNGVESLSGVVDITPSVSLNFSAEEEKMCILWDVYSVDSNLSAEVCRGGELCCGLFGLKSEPGVAWNDPLLMHYGLLQSSSENIVSAMASYADVSLELENLRYEVVRSNWDGVWAVFRDNLSADFAGDALSREALSDLPGESFTIEVESEPGVSVLISGVNYSTESEVESEAFSGSVLSPDRDLFFLGEEPVFSLALNPPRVTGVKASEISVSVADWAGDVVDAASSVAETGSNRFGIKLTLPRSVRPGVHTLTVFVPYDGENYIFRRNFSVSSLDFEFEHRTIAPGDYVHAGVSGFGGCNESVTLSLTYPDGQTRVLPTGGRNFAVSDSCNTLKGVTDYEFVYRPYYEGAYALNLSTPGAGMAAGGVFEVSGENSFDVRRIGPRVVEPGRIYEMSFVVSVSRGFEGVFRDFVPAGIAVDVGGDSGAVVEEGGGFSVVSFNRSFLPGESAELKYSFTVPAAGFFHSFGPWDFAGFSEGGRWSVASGEREPSGALISSRRDFTAGDEPSFTFSVYGVSEDFSKAAVMDAPRVSARVLRGDAVVDVPVSIKRTEAGKYELAVERPREFTAGLYRLEVEYSYAGKSLMSSQDFTWGVLAINTRKSVYLPGEDVFIGMAVLDDSGDIVCDADVTLELTDPSGGITVLSTRDGSINVSEECPVLGVTMLPDYYGWYKAGGAGVYTMSLTAGTENGVRSITDSFRVEDAVDFDVARYGPTRIYPPVPYVMNITINANVDYEGVVREYLPKSFMVAPQEGMDVSVAGDAKVLSWNRRFDAGGSYSISYEFDAPDASPQFYVFGPLDIGGWAEARQWMMASDAITDDSFVITPTSIYTGDRTNITGTYSNGGTSTVNCVLWITEGGVVVKSGSATAVKLTNVYFAGTICDSVDLATGNLTCTSWGKNNDAQAVRWEVEGQTGGGGSKTYITAGACSAGGVTFDASDTLSVDVNTPSSTSSSSSSSSSSYYSSPSGQSTSSSSSSSSYLSSPSGQSTSSSSSSTSSSSSYLSSPSGQSTSSSSSSTS